MKVYLINDNMKIKNLLPRPKYIIRLDDASHFSDLSKWNKIASILDNFNIRPIVAVIPNNKDNTLFYSKFNNNFWNLISSWQNKNWSIAMHGYDHIFHKINRKNLFFPFYNRSEFAGLPLNSQKNKIKKSFKIFKQNGINPKIWVAPAHSFDSKTLIALKETTDILIVSDGISFYPYFSNDFYFIPQQIWDIENKLFGIWTICLHPDTMSIKDIEHFELKIKSLVDQGKMTNVDEINFTKRSKSIFEKIYSLFYWTKYELKYLLKNRHVI